MAKLTAWLLSHKRLAVEAILSLLIALSVACGITLYNKNKKLSEGLEMAKNNIEAYQGMLNDSQEANNVLKLQIDDLKNSKDTVIQKVYEVAKENNIKIEKTNSVATQTQIIDVNDSKGVGGQIIVKDSVYSDSILYNPLTKVYYTIDNDSVNIRLNVQNTQYLYTYTKREYKNKKNFIKRLFTFDFKKVNKYRYEIINTNDLLKESDVRVIEITE